MLDEDRARALHVAADKVLASVDVTATGPRPVLRSQPTEKLCVADWLPGVRNPLSPPTFWPPTVIW